MQYAAIHRARERWFAGITWRGLALIALLCVLNAARRSIQHSIGVIPFDDWLLSLAEVSARGLIVALPITLAVVATFNRVPATPWLRYPALALALTVSSIVGVAILTGVESDWTFEFNRTEVQISSLMVFFAAWLWYFMLAALFTAVFVYCRAAEESDARAHDAELARARFDQQMDEARLQVLQAQIEPHFLFNTLATVRRLYQTAPETAVAMLDNLMSYLAVALPQMRARDSTLGREAALAESYLSIQQIRMGRRLGFDIDVPTSLRDARLPPMMLLTLAENAIKHGVNPLPEGGTIRISAHIEGSQLRLRVADSGQGFTQSSGGGTGLANIRARLAALYGSAARLDLGLNRPHGVTATIDLPYTASTLAASPT
jgi:signal transduction histidine kinase